MKRQLTVDEFSDWLKATQRFDDDIRHYQDSDTWDGYEIRIDITGKCWRTEISYPDYTSTPNKYVNRTIEEVVKVPRVVYDWEPISLDKITLENTAIDLIDL